MIVIVLFLVGNTSRCRIPSLIHIESFAYKLSNKTTALNSVDVKSLNYSFICFISCN